MDPKAWIAVCILLLTLVNLLFKKNSQQDIFGRKTRGKMMSDFDEDQKFVDKYSK